MSFDAMPPEAWEVIAPCLAQPWPVEAAQHDLRWHAARHALRGVPLPSLRELASRWGDKPSAGEHKPWSKDRVDRLLKSAGWADVSRPWGWGEKNATAARQQRDSSATGDHGETPTISTERDTDATVTRQQRDSRALLVEHPASSTQHPEPEELPPASPASAAPGPEAPPVAETIATAATTPRKPRKPKAESEPHPYHKRLMQAWDRCWGERFPDVYPWSDREIAILVKQIRDPLVHRDERGEEDLQRVGRAMRRYLAQQVDGRYVTGLSLRGFAADPARWYAPVDGERPKNGHNGNIVDSNGKTLFDRALALITAKESA